MLVCNYGLVVEEEIKLNVVYLKNKFVLVKV